MCQYNDLPFGNPSLYKELKILGKGLDSCVVLAQDIKEQKLVALKKIDKAKLNAKSLHNVKQEIEILKKLKTLKNNYFLQIYDAFEYNNTIYIITEYIPGGELFNIIEDLPHGVPEVICKPILRQIFLAVSQLHKLNIAHLDLKLENIMYNKETETIKIIDFGYSCFGSEKLKEFNGSIHYIPPQLLYREPYDGKKADSWSLGVVTYCLLGASFPFDDENNNRSNIFFKIKRGLYPVLPQFTSHAKSFLELLLNPNENKRLNVEDILSHPFLTSD